MVDLLEELRRKIVFNEYLPGSVLNVRELAKQFNVSPTPIREALIRLESEMLVKRVPNKSVQVTELSLQDIRDIFEARFTLTDTVAILATDRITREQLKRMGELIALMRDETDRSKLLQLDYLVHNLLGEATGNEVIAGMLRTLRNQVTRLWLFVGETDEYSISRVTEFEEIKAALEQGRTEQVRQLLRKHIREFADLVAKALVAPHTLLVATEKRNAGAKGLTQS